VAIRVAPGDRVAAGAPLVDVAYPDGAAAAAAYLAATDQLAAQTTRRAQLEALRHDGLARIGELTAVDVELARLRGERDLATASLRGAGLEPGNARALVDGGGRGTLRAPIAGVVTRVDAAIGQARGPDAPALVAIARAGAHRIEATLARPLPTGAIVRFTPSGGVAVAAALVELEPRAASDGTRRGWFTTTEELRAGQPGRLEVTVADDAVVIPASALVDDAGHAAVWLRDGAAARKVAVEVLARSGGDAIVRGLAATAELRARASEQP
jgi:hypothetical protein